MSPRTIRPAPVLAALAVSLALGACAVDPLVAPGRPCSAELPCGPNARCDTALGICVEQGALDAASDACAAGRQLCAGACVDTATDHRHCGGCGKACADGQDCVAGQCRCVAGGRCAGCCAGTACVALSAQTATSCGGAGAACTICDDGLACTTDTCSAGACGGLPVSGSCVIQGACVADQAVDPANGCQRCDSADNPNGWSWAFTQGCVETAAGSGLAGFQDGPAAAARFNKLTGLTVDAAGTIYMVDHMNEAIRKLAGGQVTTVAGTGQYGYKDGPAAQALFGFPNDLVADASGKLYVADAGNHVIRLIDQGVVSTFAGDGLAGSLDGPIGTARFKQPQYLALDGAGALYVSDGGNLRVRKIAGGTVTTLAGSGLWGYMDGPAASARFRDMRGIAVNPAGTAIYLVDNYDHVVRKVEGGVVSTLAGSGHKGYVDGPVASARFSSPTDLIVTASGDLIVADTDNDVLRRVSGGVVSTVVGVGASGHLDGPALKAALARPLAVGLDPATGLLYVGETAYLRRWAP